MQSDYRDGTAALEAQTTFTFTSCAQPEVGNGDTPLAAPGIDATPLWGTAGVGGLLLILGAAALFGVRRRMG